MTTLAEFIDAIEENGAPQYFEGNYRHYNTITQEMSYCAIGMAAHNLNKTFDYMDNTISQKFKMIDPPDDWPDDWMKIENRYVNLGGYIVHLNDNRMWTFKQIADHLREIFTPDELSTTLW